MSDIEADEIERFQHEKERRLAEEAGMGQQDFVDTLDSEEEVMNTDSGDSESSAESDNLGQESFYDSKSEKQKADNAGWGMSRANYYGGEDDVGADSEASIEEEEEALRLQQKQLERMEEDDFIDEDDMESWQKEAASAELPEGEIERLPAQDPTAMSAEERDTYLKTTNPEAFLLFKELEQAEKSLAESNKEDSTVGSMDLKKVALRSYLGTLYSYFALFTSLPASKREDIKEHPVMEGILKARELWNAAKQLHDPDFRGDEQPIDQKKTSISDQDGQLSPEPEAKDVPEIDSESESGSEPGSEPESEPESESESESAAGTRASKGDESFENSDDEFSIRIPQPKLRPISVHNDFDETADTIEQQARQKNKQSLRFYTSQVGKRDRDPSREEKFSGDIDIPYREREFERRRRLLEEARKRGQKEKDDIGYESNDDDVNDEINQNSLYSEVQKQRAEASRTKQQRHLEAVEAAKQGRIKEYLAQHPNVDKRAIDYQIRKNKGLTPKRKKENRNARVKKRVRFSQAQKKLSGVRPRVRESTGPYGGELTGIRKNLSHSRKFTS